MFDKDIKEVIVIKFIITPQLINHCFISLGKVEKITNKTVYVNTKYGTKIFSRENGEEIPEKKSLNDVREMYGIFKKEDDYRLQRGFNVGEMEFCGFEIKEGYDIFEKYVDMNFKD